MADVYLIEQEQQMIANTYSIPHSVSISLVAGAESTTRILQHSGDGQRGGR